ncbi:MAG: hypothetical protein ATN34_04750 [Epulopiscium sp. Nele67-Bin002]|nr:MAG: hypothetical protein ATN34_04750 [Epulopiscium sp. Nele67-Bin002]
MGLMNRKDDYMTVLYLTATGNSMYIAKSLGGEAYSIPKMIKDEKYEFTDDKIGFVFPIYSNSVPPYISEFIKKSKFNSDYIFGVMTYGAYDGAAPNHLMDIGKQAGIEFAYINTIKMVDNWLPGFNMKKQVENEHKKDISTHLAEIKADIDSAKSFILKTNCVDRKITAHWVKKSDKQTEKGSLHGYSTGRGIKDYINVQDTCTQCGVCTKVCPVNNIRVDKEHGKISLGEHCISCFACTHNCPTNSIRMKGEKSTDRFRNSHVTLKDIIAANS